MNLKNQPPVFVPDQFQREIEKFPKAALMDMVWDLATRAAGADELAVNEIMGEVRHTAKIIDSYRKQDRAKNGNWRDRLEANAK
jgi:hypothetical protein